MTPSEFREGLAKAINSVTRSRALTAEEEVQTQAEAAIAYLETAGVEIRTVVGNGYMAERIIIPLADWLMEGQP